MEANETPEGSPNAVPTQVLAPSASRAQGAISEGSPNAVPMQVSAPSERRIRGAIAPQTGPAFCPTCGSGIYSRTAGMPHLIFLRASALDDPALPQLAVWADRAPAWDAVPAHLPAFAEAPIGN